MKKVTTYAELFVYDWSTCGETKISGEVIKGIDSLEFEEHKYKRWRTEAFPKKLG